MTTYEEAYARSMADPEGFWGEAADAIDWERPFDRVLDDSNPPFYHWYPGGELNTCFNALDRHVDGGRADQPALIYDSPVTDTTRRYTYRELRDEVARFAGALRSIGVDKGDRVVIYMPMIPEAVVAMLGCARIGAVHSVVFGGFAAKELATRIDDARPRVIVSASCGIETTRLIPYKPLLDRALEIARHAVEHCIVFQRPQLTAELLPERDLDWLALMAAAEPVPCVPVAATDPLYVLYTSGTTGIPKGVVRDNGGHAVALAWSMRNIYGASPGEVFWAASDVGWVVGHSYIVYGPLLIGCTTVLYEGKPVGTPDAGAFWRVIADHRVATLFTAPTAFRAIRQQDPEAEHVRRYDLSGFRALFLAGERCDPDTLAWAEQTLGVPVIDHWWQTETGWPITASFLGLDGFGTRAGSAGRPTPGYDVRVLSEDGDEVDRSRIGNITIRMPLPPGTLPTLWENDRGFVDSYLNRFEGHYLTGDAGFRDPDGYVWIMSRIDDIINVAGHRLSTGGMEEVLASHADVAECAVIGVADPLKGQVPIGFVVLKQGADRPHDQISTELVDLVRERIGPVAAFRKATVVPRLPKTRSGKILRGTMRQIADGERPGVPATIDDPAVLGEITNALSALGYPGRDPEAHRSSSRD